MTGHYSPVYWLSCGIDLIGRNDRHAGTSHVHPFSAPNMLAG
jgi:hypothetical protein